MYTRNLNLPTLSILPSTLFWGLWWIPLRWVKGLGLAPLVINAFLYGMGAVLPMTVISGITLGLTLVTWNLTLLQVEIVRITLLFYLSAT